MKNITVKHKFSNHLTDIALALAFFLIADTANAVINECTYGNSGGMCYVGSYGDEPDTDGKKAPPSDYADPEDGRDRGDADSLSDAPPLWNSGTAFVGTPTGSTGPISSGSGVNFLQTSVEQKLAASSREVANATRPEGPCFRPQALQTGVTHVLPAGTQFFIGLNWSKGMDPNFASIINTALLALTDGMNQWFGSQPATTLQGQTMSDTVPGSTPLNYHFQVYSSLDEANTAAGSSGASSKMIIPISDVNWAPKDGAVTAGATKYTVTAGMISSAKIYFNVAYIDTMKRFLDEGSSDFALKQQIVNSELLDYVMNMVGPHEFGHAIGLEHIVFGQPVDDDYSPLVYSGTRDKDIRRILDSSQTFIPPYSPCDAAIFDANR